MSRVSGTKTTQKSTFFKMGVSLGRPHWKRDIIRISNRLRRTTWATTGIISKIPTRVLATLPNPTPTHPTHNPRGGGGTLIFSYIRRLGSFFGVKILNFNIFWGFQKYKCFLGYEDFVEMFWGHHLIGLYLGVISMHFRVKVQNRGYFLGLLKFQMFFWDA